MRAAFALVLTLGIGAAITVSAIRRHAAPEDGEATGGEETALVTKDVEPSPADRDVEERTAEPPLALQLDELLERGDSARAADVLLRADAEHLQLAPLRDRAFRIVDGLLESAKGAGAAPARLHARGILAALYDCDDAEPEEHDRALELTRKLHRIVLQGHNADPKLVHRHEVQPGDRVWSLWKGAWREAGVTVSPGFILHVNGVRNAASIRVGQVLRVPREELSLLIRKSRYELTVLLGGAPIERFPIGIGKDERTPSGEFEISTRLKNPDWYFEGRRIPFGHPDHIIGTRWMGFTGDPLADGIGIHGTTDATSIGKAESAGCIRMRDSDVERLFEWVAQGTRVDLRD